MKIYSRNDAKIARKELRNNATFEEKLLWSRLQNNKLSCKFRRQQSIGFFIVDFYCKEQKLIIEIDGQQHDRAEEKQYDNDRSGYFRTLGFRVLRFWNSEINKNIESVIIKIKKSINPPPP